MIRFRSDFDRGADPSRRYLPWIIAFMVFLAVLALAAAMAVSAAIDSWGKGLQGTLTVQVPPSVTDDAGTDAEDRLAQVADILRGTAGVESARVLPEDESRALLDPWLGALGRDPDLPVPRLIDVRLRAGTNIDLDRLGARLDAAAPGIAIDDHGRWLSDLAKVAEAIQLGAAAVVAVIVLAAILTVVYATRSGIAVHLATIEVLHLMGAEDRYVARQFQRQAFWLGLLGGLIGLAGAAGVLWMTGRMAPQMELSALPAFMLTQSQIIVLALMPLAAAAIAMAAARATVMRALRRMI